MTVFVPPSISVRCASVSVAPVVVTSSITKQIVFGGIGFFVFIARCIFLIRSLRFFSRLWRCVCRVHSSRLFSYLMLLPDIFLYSSLSMLCMWSYPFLFFRSLVAGTVQSI